MKKNVKKLHKDNILTYPFVMKKFIDEQNVIKPELETREQTEIKQPPLYRVLLLNDDFTPMDFVVHVLQHFFNKSEFEATHIMLTIHNCGQGLCGQYTHDIAETKVQQVNNYSRTNEHPLLCIMETIQC
ncbi:MAG: ATP-dependent Clp protease adapter ClpS [Mariprofundales bacterium]